MKKENSFFGKQLKKILYEKNITQQELADKLGIKRPMISQWITSSRNPSLTSVRKIAEVLKTDINYFLQEKKSSEDEKINLKFIMNFIEENNKRINAEMSLMKKEIETIKETLINSGRKNM